MTADLDNNDPNEANELRPKPECPHGPRGWWEVTRSGIPVYHGPDLAEMERLASDPAARAAMVRPPVKKLWER